MPLRRPRSDKKTSTRTMGWSRVSDTWTALPRRVSSRRSPFRKKPPDLHVNEKRAFLSYAFVRTGSADEGFLVQVSDVDLCTIYASEPETGLLSEDQIRNYADDLGVALSLEMHELLDTLQSIWDAKSRAEFDERLILHLLHLDEWRANIRSAKEAEFSIEDASSKLILLEIGDGKSTYQGKPFCDLNSVSVYPFDFRPMCSDSTIGRGATEAEHGIEISCAAMIVLLQIVDGLGNEHSICERCSRLSSGAKRILQVRGAIMRLYR